MNVELDRLLERLQGVGRAGMGFRALCPAHPDRTPSLSIREANGRILVKCFAGCTAQDVCKALGIDMRALFADADCAKRIVAEYSYTDENRILLYQNVRFDPKDFRLRKPNGKGGWTWKLGDVRRVLYRLSEVLKAKSVLVVEGEKDADSAFALGFIATCNPCGAGKWREGYSDSLSGKGTTIIADSDTPGRKHAAEVAASLAGKVNSLKVLELPGAKDLTEWMERGGTCDVLLDLIRNTPEWKPQDGPPTAAGSRIDPWSLAAGMDIFLQQEEQTIGFLFAPLIVKEALTEIFSPRGLGKSLWALFVAVSAARVGHKVLLIDRDNPRRVLRDRLRSFGATSSLTHLKILSRESAPPLTNTRAWSGFPYMDHDLVIVDSLDSSSEGVGEQDSTKPSLAIASLLDIAHREKGPAVLVLGNTVKSAAHSRGSGIVEDRADIVFEVRDATSFHPTGKKPWIEELPAADAGSWAARSTRRNRLSRYRLAFVATKFRIGEEPEPFVVEIDLAAEPWTVKDVTDLVDEEGAEARKGRAQEKDSAASDAVELLKAEVLRRHAAGEPEILKKQAEAFLTSRDVTQRVARDAINSAGFEAVEIVGKGRPKPIRLANSNHADNRIVRLVEAPIYAGCSNPDFGQADAERLTETGDANTQCLKPSQTTGVSVEHTSSDPIRLSQDGSVRSDMKKQGTEEEL